MSSVQRKDVGSWIKYRLIDNNTKGELGENVTIKTPITGYHVEVDEPHLKFILWEDGTLDIDESTIWDFGSGPAINTPAMVRASLVHDMFCIMTNRGLIPWKERKHADNLFAKLLWRYGPKKALITPVLGVITGFRWLGVSAYSQLIARWRDRK